MTRDDPEWPLWDLVWTGKSVELATHPVLDPSTWVGAVHADMNLYNAEEVTLPPARRGDAYPKACLIMMARDEVDLLETNLVWHYQMGFRRMVVSDNRSVDGSLNALLNLRTRLTDAEIVILSDPIERYTQGLKMTGLLRFASQVWPECTWVFPIDADEFLCPTLGLMALDGLGSDTLVISKLNHFLDRPDPDPIAYTVLGSMPIRTRLGFTPPKVALRPNPDYAIAQGNHYALALAGTTICHQGGLSVGLYYREFQVRSFAQFKTRVINGARAVLCAEKHVGHAMGGDHWKLWYATLQAQGDEGLRRVFETYYLRTPGDGFFMDRFDGPL